MVSQTRPRGVAAIYTSGPHRWRGHRRWCHDPSRRSRRDVSCTRTKRIRRPKLEVQVTTFTDDAIILEAREALEEAAAQLSADVGDAVPTVSVSGDVITMQDTLAAFTGSMVISLPIAIFLTVPSSSAYLFARFATRR